jgi:large subunit ribosomal protein L14
VHFNDNVTSVINQERNLKRTCVFGPIAWELWESNFTKIILLAPEIL